MNSQSLAEKILQHLRLFGGKLSTQRERKMRLCETLSLGERRFLAVVMVEQQKFLVGGAANSVALLAELPAAPSSDQPTDARKALSEPVD